jgi:hypothetical protein
MSLKILSTHPHTHRKQHKLFSFSIILSFCFAASWTQIIMNDRQALYHWATSPIPKVNFFNCWKGPSWPISKIVVNQNTGLTKIIWFSSYENLPAMQTLTMNLAFVSCFSKRPQTSYWSLEDRSLDNFCHVESIFFLFLWQCLSIWWTYHDGWLNPLVHPRAGDFALKF